MNKLFENWRYFLGSGTANKYFLQELNVAPGFRNTGGSALDPYEYKSDTAEGEDSSISAKAVIHRNSKVLLLKNEQGWDLPGGHIKQDETTIQGLKREIYEETGLQIIDPTELNFSHGNKRFFAGRHGGGDVMLSDEHIDYDYFDKNQVQKLNISEPFMKAISMVLDFTPRKKIKINIKIG